MDDSLHRESAVLQVLSPSEAGTQLYGAGFVQTAANPKKVVWVPNQASTLSG